MKYRFIISALIFFCFGSFSSCKEPESTGPENQTDSLTLKVKETDLTSATLSLHTAGITYPASLTLTRNSQPVQTFSLHKPDTTLIDTALTPSTSYTWQAIWKKTETTFLKGEPVTVRTMDTTSHDIDWTIYYLGDRGGSRILDIEILNDTTVYGVGEVYDKDSYTHDSLGHIINPYNVVKWNGKDWSYSTLLYNVQGTPSYNYIPGIKFFSENNIWYGWIHWNGEKYEQMEIPGLNGINSIWASYYDNFYIGGDKGTLVHYNGSSWETIETGTNLDITGLYGSINSSTGLIEVYGVASDQWHTNDHKLFQINGNNILSLKGEGIVYSATQLWFHPGKIAYIVGGGLYKRKKINADENWNNIVVSKYYLSCIDGLNENDIFAGGAFGEILHFNGSTWKSYLSETVINGNLFKIEVKGKLVVACGTIGPSGVVIIGKRK